MVARTKKSHTTRVAAKPPVTAAETEAEVVAAIPAAMEAPESAAEAEPVVAAVEAHREAPRTETVVIQAEVTLPTLETIAKDMLADTAIAKIDSQMRDAAESAIAEGRKSFETAKIKAQGLTSAVEASAETLSKGITDLNAKSILALKANVETGFEHIKAVIGAKTMLDAWKLHTDLSAKHLAMLNEQARDLAAAASKFTSESVQPLKTSIEQVFARS